MTIFGNTVMMAMKLILTAVQRHLWLVVIGNGQDVGGDDDNGDSGGGDDDNGDSGGGDDGGEVSDSQVQVLSEFWM